MSEVSDISTNLFNPAHDAVRYKGLFYTSFHEALSDSMMLYGYGKVLLTIVGLL